MNELEKLYNAVSQKFDVGSFEDFSTKMGDTDSRKRFYDAVSSKGLDLGDYNEYEQRLSSGGNPKGVTAEQSGESVSASAKEGSSSDSNQPNDLFSVPNEEFYNNVRNSLGKYKTLRDGSGRVVGYDPNKQTPMFDPVTGKIAIKDTPSKEVRQRVLDKVKEESGIPNEVINDLEKRNKLKYIKDVSDYLFLMDNEFAGKTADEVINEMGIDFKANAASLKADVDEAVQSMPFYEHEGKQLNSRLSADKDFIDIFPNEPELEAVTNSDDLGNIFGDMKDYGYNLEDFNMFLESTNPRLKALVDKGILGPNSDGITKDLPTEMEMFKNLRAYTVDRLKYLNKYEKALDYRKSNGEDVDSELDKVEQEREGLTSGFVKYAEDNLTAFTDFMDKQTIKQARKYEAYKNGQGNLLDDTLEKYSQGFFGGVQDLAIFLADGIGADDFAEEARISKSIQNIGEAEPLLDMWGQGRTVEYKGTKYMVTNEGQIIDMDAKKNITSIVDKIGINSKELIEKAKNGEVETFFSPYNTTVQSGGVMGNLTVQLMGTRGLGGVIGNTKKAQVASTMVMTGGMVYASTYEQVLQELRDSGVSEKEAVEGANQISMATATVAALTSTFAYNPKAQQLLGGDRMKKLVTAAVAANKEGGKKAMFDAIKSNTIKILASGGKEGFEETIQENLEYITQKLASADVNDKIGRDVLDEQIKVKDIIDNSILAFGASSMLAGVGELSNQDYNQDKLEMLQLLSSDYAATVSNVDNYVSQGLITQSEGDNLLTEVERVLKHIDKMPENVPNQDKLELINLLDQRDNLELRKKNENKAFHKSINEEIEKVDTKIGEVMGRTPKKNLYKTDPELKSFQDELKNIGAPQSVIDALPANAKLNKKFLIDHDANLFSRLFEVGGFYDPTTDEVQINKTMSSLLGTGKKTLLHEAVHAGTVNEMYRIAVNPEDYTQDQIDAVNTIKQTMEGLKSKTTKGARKLNSLYGLTNEYEFVAEFVSNPNFRNWVGDNAGRKGKVNVLSKVWDNILRVLGLKPNSINQTLIDNVQGAIDKTLKISELKNTIYKSDKPINSQEELEVVIGDGAWGMLTGENPNAQQATDEENKANNEKAKEWLEKKGYNPQPIKGKYGGNTENSFLVKGLTREDAVAFAKKFNQESVATDEGLVSQDGSYYPRTLQDTFGDKYEDNYSTISTKEGDVDFNVGYNFDEKRGGKTNEPNKKNDQGGDQVTDQGGTTDKTGEDTGTTGDVPSSNKFKKLADNIRNLKTDSKNKDDMSKLSSKKKTLFTEAWDTTIETVAVTVELTGDVLMAVQDGIQSLKNSEWYRNLSDEGKAKAERMMREDLDRQFGEEETYNPSFAESIKASFDKIKETTIQKFVDKFHILRKAVNKNFKITDDSVNFSQAEINMHGKAANDLDKFDAEMESLIKEIADKGLTVDNVSDYLYAKHAEERNKHIKENIDPENEFGSGMTPQEADRILNRTFTGDQINDLEALSKKFYNITQGTREMMLDYGLITQEQYNSLVDYYENYVPLKGFENESIEAVGNIQGTRLDVQGNMTKRAAGRSTRADNVIANIISERVAVNMKARKNEVLQTLYKLAEENPDNEVMTVYTPKNLPKKLTVQQDGTKVKQPERPDAREDYVGVKVDGEQFYIKFANKELGRVLNAANVEKADIITKTLRSVNRYLSATLTSLNPEFVISNFARDIQTAVFNVTAESDINAALKGQNIAKNVVRDTGKSIKAIYANERKGKVDSEFQKYYDEFKEDGAKTGWANQNNLADIKKKLENIHKMRTKKTVKGGLKNMLEFVNDVNTAVENGVRLSAYVNGRKAGMTRPQAAAMAKELTVNFNKSGEYGTVANSLYLFFNAAVQGNVRFIKAMTTLKKTVQPDGTIKKSLNRGQKLALSMMAFASLVTMLNQAISDDDEDGQSFYSKIPDFEKERNLIVMNPLNGRDYFKVPLPYGYNIFHNMGTVATEVSTGERSVGDGLGFMTSSAVGAFSPISFGHSDNPAGVISSAVIPTIVKPLVDLQANEDYFGSQIYNENLPFGVPKPDSDLGRTSTPEAFIYTAKFLNEVSGGNDFESGALDFAPESLYYLFKFGIGGTGKFLMNTAETVDTGIDIASGQEKDLEARKIPFVRKVYAEPNEYVDQSNYFERFEMLQQRELAIKDRMRNGEATNEDRKDYSKVAGTVKAYKETNKKLSEIRKKKKAAREIADPILRTKRLRALDDLYFRLIKKVNGLYNKRLGENYE